MNVHTSYRNLPKTPDLERELRQQIEKLKKRLQVFRPELMHLRVAVEETKAREGITVSADLRLPSGDVAVRQVADSAEAAIKAAFDQLTEQVNKHKNHLRAQWKWPRRRREGRPGTPTEVPFETTIAAVRPPTISADDIALYVNANLHRLFLFIEREILYRETAGILQRNQVTPEEVVDEVIATALGDSQDRPEKVTLEPWLYRLAMRAIDDVVNRNRDQVVGIPLEQAAKRDDRDVSVGTDEGVLQFHQPDEAVANEDLIADARVATPEATFYNEEMVSLVESALLKAHPQDREAFLLYVIEGFTPDEIAVISERPVDQVKKSVVSARDYLRKVLPVPDEFKNKLLQQARIA